MHHFYKHSSKIWVIIILISIVISNPISVWAQSNVPLSCDQVEGIPISECNTLQAFYTNTGGTGWTDNTNWFANPNPSFWYGVTVTSGHVSQLHLTTNNLTGNLPDLSGLPNLTQLYLQENQLGGTIPSTLGSLTGLNYLDLSRNDFTGGIPASFGNLVNLISLYLTNNRLTGAIPDLSALTQLKQLALSYNDLSGSIPNTLGQLANLEWLLLFKNNLSGSIPASLGNLTKLTRIELAYNPLLSGSLPPELGDITTLQILIVSNTSLSQTIPDPAYTNLLALFLFKFSGTTICEPDTVGFTEWKAGVTTWESSGLLCNYPDGIPISGIVTDRSGAPQTNVTITALGPDETAAPVVTGADGTYRMYVKKYGTYQLTPSRISASFYPQTLTVQVNTERSNQNFLARAVTCYAAGQPNGLPCTNRTSAPFLQLPFVLPSGTTIDQALQDADFAGGLVTSWFDHSAPDASAGIILFDGEVYATHSTAGLLPAAVCFNRHCAGALRGIGLKSPQPGATTTVFPAADGTITEICNSGACARGASLGRYLVIQHNGTRYATLYANLSTVAGNLTVGNPVTTATTIGTLAPGERSLNFVVFFRGTCSNNNCSLPWTPNAAEAVDPFGWRPYDERADGWPMPSVPLWKDFHPTLSEAPETYTSVLSSGGVTVSKVNDALPAWHILTLADSSLGTLLAPDLRSVGRAFQVKILDSSNWTVFETSSPGFTVQADFTGANFTHLDTNGVALYQLVGGTWTPIATGLSNNIASATIQPSGKFAVAAPLLCPSDTREPYDDTADRYKNGSVWNLGAPWDGMFDTPADQDWVAIDMIAGATYNFEITPAANIDLALTLYGPNAGSPLVTNDPAIGQTGQFQWKAQSTGIHYLRVSQSAGSAADCSPYQIVETDTVKHIFLPAIAR